MTLSKTNLAALQRKHNKNRRQMSNVHFKRKKNQCTSTSSSGRGEKYFKQKHPSRDCGMFPTEKELIFVLLATDYNFDKRDRETDDEYADFSLTVHWVSYESNPTFNVEYFQKLCQYL